MTDSQRFHWLRGFHVGVWLHGVETVPILGPHPIQVLGMMMICLLSKKLKELLMRPPRWRRSTKRRLGIRMRL